MPVDPNKSAFEANFLAKRGIFRCQCLNLLLKSSDFVDPFAELAVQGCIVALVHQL